MSSTAQETAAESLVSLDERLQRLHFLLHGDAPQSNATSPPNPVSQPAASRLQTLRSSFDSLLSHSPDAQRLVTLQTQHEEPVPHMTQDALAALVLSHAPSYQATAARLTSLQDLPVPDSSSSASLVALDPRLHRLLRRQQEQQDAIANLRHQSLALLARWYDTGIIAMDDCWTEWEARLMDQERQVRRAEAEQRRNQDTP